MIAELLLCSARKVLEELPQRVRLRLPALSFAAYPTWAILVAFLMTGVSLLILPVVQ
jgi:hypothetical protein